MPAQPPWATPTPWNNQDITLYHGTLAQHADSIVENGIDLKYANAKKDFGRGFYTTTMRREAESFAYRARDAARRNDPSARPGVVEFTISRDSIAGLDCLWFVQGEFGADAYWSFVFYCRSGQSGHARTVKGGWYDVVVGPVVASWRQRVVLQGYDQASFHTDDAVRLLNSADRRLVT
jgi:hypothetical protein